MKNTNHKKVLKKLFRKKLSVIGLAILIVVIFISVFSSALAPYDYTEINPIAAKKAPSAEHLFGTDELGRDVLSRIMAGASVTFTVGFVAVAFALVIGTALGLIAGFYGGKVDAVISSAADAIWSFPNIILALVITTAIGAGMKSVILAIGIVYVPGFTRIVRNMTLSVREMEYVMGARAVGLNNAEIITRYILPNVFPTIIVQTSLYSAQAMLTESTLSFMGLGITAPQVSWGLMLKSGFTFIRIAPWLVIVPSVAILLTVLGLNFLGDGLRDALDVKIGDD